MNVNKLCVLGFEYILSDRPSVPPYIRRIQIFTWTHLHLSSVELIVLSTRALTKQHFLGHYLFV